MDIIKRNLEEGVLGITVDTSAGSGGKSFSITGKYSNGKKLFDFHYDEHHDEKDGTTPQDATLANLNYRLGREGFQASYLGSNRYNIFRKKPQQ